MSDKQSKRTKHVISVPEDVYEWLGKIQAGLKFRYNKTISQIQIAFHINQEEIKSDDYDKIIEEVYNRWTEQKEGNDKKKVVSLE